MNNERPCHTVWVSRSTGSLNVSRLREKLRLLVTDFKRLVLILVRKKELKPDSFAPSHRLTMILTCSHRVAPPAAVAGESSRLKHHKSTAQVIISPGLSM